MRYAVFISVFSSDLSGRRCKSSPPKKMHVATKRKEAVHTSYQWAELGYVVKAGCEGEEMWCCQTCKYTAIYYREDEVEKNTRKARAFLKKAVTDTARFKYRVATYRKMYDHKVIDTREGWAKKGFVVIQRRRGEVMFTNGFLGRTARYYYDTDVKKDDAAAGRFLELLRRERNARRRELARTRKDRVHAAEVRRIKEEAIQAALEAEKRGCWLGYLSPNPKILLFDCETGGLDCVDNDMLSLSYQLIEFQTIGRKEGQCSVKVLEKGDFFFDWPEDEGRVTDEAIDVNGLTRERLAELGTTDRKTAIITFANALTQARMAVAHNAAFDCGFINTAAVAVDVQVKWPRVYDTMTRMTDYCKFLWYEGARKFKWPRLSELAEILEVDTTDIEFHLSSADVEVTKRCLLKIIGGGLDYPFTCRI